MGAYLSSPITEKENFEGEGSGIRFGGSAMQGWRRTMEDAHLAVPAVADDPNVALFGVFDGHGGAEVAKFCQKYMVKEITRMKEFNEEGNVEDSLVRVFHRIDEMLRDSKYSEELQQLRTKEATEEEEGGEDGDGVSAMDALDLLKRVFQLKRFMGDNSNGTAGAAGAGAAAGGEGSAGGGAAAGAAGGGGAGAMKVEEDEALVQAGCTAVVALKRGNDLYVANAGDSRGVLCRGGKAVALSEDHKPAQESERMRIIAAGGFLSEIGGVCRVNGNLNLSRAIGDLKYKNNGELHPKDQIITAQPDIRKFTLQPEDTFFLLACDGVWDVMTNQDAVDYVNKRLAEGLTPAQVSSSLLDHCLASDPKEARGVGCDNMTAIVVVLPAGIKAQAAAKPAGGAAPTTSSSAKV